MAFAVKFLKFIYHILKRIIIRNPLVRAVKAWEYNYRFKHAENANLFKGVYHSFDEALEHTPPTKKTGYDHTQPAQMYRDRMNRIYPSDYPVVFWLNKIKRENQHLFEIGGHVGVSYYAYQRIMDYPSTHSWLICDVPAVADAGQKIAKDKGETNIRFTTDMTRGDGNDILLASGSLQYIDVPLPDIICHYKEKPHDILINLLPIYDGPTFVTLQNIGTAFCPYRIFNKDQFIQALCRQGYELIDIWENAEKSMTIPFREDRSLSCYHGMYFKKSDD